MVTETLLSNNISDSLKILEITRIIHNFNYIPKESEKVCGIGILVKKTPKASLKNELKIDSFE